MAQFIEELKRRNVLRVGLAYLAVAWLVLQVAETLLPIYGFSDAAVRNVVTLLIVGFIISVALSWSFEWTPDGILKDTGSNAQNGGAQATRNLDRLIILSLVAAVAFFAVDKFILDPARDARIIEEAAQKARADALSTADRERSVAVLPFANRSNRDDDVYFADGIHDDILTQLARIDALVVTSRTSVEQFRDTTQSIPEIGSALDVRTVLEGGVQRAGDRVRINVQLIDTSNDDHLWAETYERELTTANIFEVQADIAAAVAEQLRATLMPAEQQSLARVPTESYEAYDLYLLGRYHLYQRTKESIDLAHSYFQQAVDQDPQFVRALSGLADSYLFSVDYGTLTGNDAFPQAARVIDQAMALDDSSSEVWASYGRLRQDQLDYGAATAAYRKAITLDPENDLAWYWYSGLLWLQRRYSDALEARKTAYALEPMSRVINTALGHAYYDMGDFAQAIEHYTRAQQVSGAQSPELANNIASNYYWAGELAKGIEKFREQVTRDPEDWSAIGGIVYGYVALNDLDEAGIWDQRAAVITDQYQLGYVIPEARQDYEAVVAYFENTLKVHAPTRNIQVLAELFKANFLIGNEVTALDYLDEVLDSLQGRIEVAPTNFMQHNNLYVAGFWMNYGDTGAGERRKGRALAEEVRDRMSDLKDAGWLHPVIFVSLAGAESLLGNSELAIQYLNDAIDSGYRDQVRTLDELIFDNVRELPGFAAISARIDQLRQAELEQLSQMTFAAYSPPAEREIVHVPRELLERYAGWFSDGNVLVHAYIDDDGQIFGQRGQDVPLLFHPISETEFFPPAENFYTTRVVLDEQENPTHYVVSGSFGEILFKRVPDPLPPIELPRESLARFEGTYSYDRLGGLQSERAETDIWSADIYVDDDGVTWVDYDNQPKLRVHPTADHVLDVIGFDSELTFSADPVSGQFDQFTLTTDGANRVFRRDPDH